MKVRFKFPCCDLEVRANTDDQNGITHKVIGERVDTLHFNLCIEEQYTVRKVKVAPVGPETQNPL